MSLRMALGARAEQVSALMVRGALRMAVSGALVGLVVAVGVTRALAGLLFEVSPVDPVSLGGAALLLTGVAAAAGYLPARRAARVHPMEALRHE
jgi:ABC-type antimicrobial peptide transport system permease subunit